MKPSYWHLIWTHPLNTQLNNNPKIPRIESKTDCERLNKHLIQRVEVFVYDCGCNLASNGYWLVKRCGNFPVVRSAQIVIASISFCAFMYMILFLLYTNIQKTQCSVFHFIIKVVFFFVRIYYILLSFKDIFEAFWNKRDGMTRHDNSSFKLTLNLYVFLYLDYTLSVVFSVILSSISFSSPSSMSPVG